MEFRFNVNEIFKKPIVEINSSLIPPDFSGDRRALWDAIAKTTEVINAMGEASARAQGLMTPVTTADRLRNSEQTIYLLIDKDARNGKGAVTGMLKTGKKGLYIFDRDGQHYQVSPLCVLDFYVHESRQRTGLGKHIFEHMLEKEKLEPVKVAIDRPSDRFLGFLNKHYGLKNPVKQMNNYVVYDGFFPEGKEQNETEDNNNSGTPGRNVVQKQSANGLQSYSSPYGRYGAPRPPCSMGQIIHNQSSTVQQNQESSGNNDSLRQTQSVNMTKAEEAYSSVQANAAYSAPNMMQTQQGYQNYQQIPQAYTQNVMSMNNANLGATSAGGGQSGNMPQNANNYAHNVIPANNANLEAASVGGIQSGNVQQNANYYAQNVLPQMQNQYSQQLAPGYTPSITNLQQPQYQTVPQTTIAPVTIPNNTPLQYTTLTQSTPGFDHTLQNMQQVQAPYMGQTQQSMPYLPPRHTLGQTTMNTQPIQQSYQTTPIPSDKQIAQTPQTNMTYVPQENYLQHGQSLPQFASDKVAQNVHPNMMQYANSVPSTPRTNEMQNMQFPMQQTAQVSEAQYGNMQPQVYQTTQHMPNATPQMQAANVSQPMVPQNMMQAANVAPPMVSPNLMQPAYSLPNVPTNAAVPAMPHSASAEHIQAQMPMQMASNNVELSQQGDQNVLPQTYVQQSQQMHPQYSYYDSSAKMLNAASMPQNQNANVPATEVRKKPSASGDMGVRQKTSEYLLEYPPRSKHPPTIPSAAAESGYKSKSESVQEEEVQPSPKLERPRSLSIQISVEEAEKQEEKNLNEAVSEVPEEIDENVDDTFDVKVGDHVEVVTSKLGTSVQITDQEENSVGRKTPSHLTEQGFFDLKFYHNKLW